MKKLRIPLFILIGVMLFLLIQDVLTPDWSDVDNIAYTIGGINRIIENAVDVFYVGTSHVEYGVSPMKIYEDTGICSYSLATSVQPLPVSYYVLKEGFKRQSPSVVVLDAGKIFDDGAPGDASWRYVIDNQPLLPPNIEMAREYGDQVEDDDALNALIPLVKYHSRWKDIPQKAYGFKDTEMYYTAGQYINSVVLGTGYTLEGINEEAYSRAEKRTETVKYIQNGTYRESEKSKELYKPEITEYGRKWFLRIKDLCEEHNAQLLLIKIPVQYTTVMYGAAWTEIKSELARDFAEDVGVPYFDMLYDVDCGIDFAADTCDGGLHLNLRGAEKTAAVLGTYLQEHYDLKPQDNEQFNAALEEYRKVREAALLQSEVHFDLYLERLRDNMNRWSIFLSANADCRLCVSEENDAVFSDMGLKLFQECEFRDSYAAAIETGNVLYEGAASASPISCTVQASGRTVSMSSSGWDTGPDASIKLDGKEYSLNTRGLNIVVVDDETGLVVDSVVFDTDAENRSSRNSTDINAYLRAYEAVVCFA